MKKREKLTISIPFPAWDGIFKVHGVWDELRKNEIFKDLFISQTPRRIEMSEGKPAEEFDDVVIVKYWYCHGCYATASLGGIHDSSYGTGWKLTSLKFQWKDDSYYITGKSTSALLDAEQIATIDLARYLRLHLCDYEGHPNLEAAKKDMLVACAASEHLIQGIADRIRNFHKSLGIKSKL